MGMSFDELLARDGLAPDTFEPDYVCTNCDDTGVTRDGVCDCVLGIMKKTAYERLNRSTPLELCS